jgi:hypothetical protein
LNFEINVVGDSITPNEIYNLVSRKVDTIFCINNIPSNGNYPITSCNVYVKIYDSALSGKHCILDLRYSGATSSFDITFNGELPPLTTFYPDDLSHLVKKFAWGFDVNPNTRDEEEYQQGMDDLISPSSQEQQQNFEDWYNEIIEPLMEEYSEYNFAVSYGIDENGEFYYDFNISKAGHDSLDISDSYGYDSTEMKNYVANYGRQCDYEDWLQDSGIQEFIGSTGKGYEINYGLDENHQFQESIEVWEIDPETGQEIPDSRRELPIYNENGGGEFWVKSSGEHLLTSSSSLIQNPLRLLMRSS